MAKNSNHIGEEPLDYEEGVAVGEEVGVGVGVGEVVVVLVVDVLEEELEESAALIPMASRVFMIDAETSAADWALILAVRV